MDFKQIVLKTTPSDHNVGEKHYVEWNELDFSIVKGNKELKEYDNKNKEYKTLCDNEQLLYDLTNELKEKFEFEGLLYNCNMLSLFENIIKNMKCEEVDLDVEEDDYTSEEDEIYF
jgi:desulfoferrodoxin (superoxide reductase-like protein)